MLFSSDSLRGHARRYWRDDARSLVRVLVLLTGISLTGFSTAALAAPDSASADLPGIAPVYRSAFDGYRSWQDRPVQPWTASNEATARAGGWRAYAREAARDAARESTVAPAAASSPQVKPPAGQQPAKGSTHAH